jgi:predicted ATPase
MAIKELFVSHDRPIRNIRFHLNATNVLTGPYGCGKSNLYNSLFLLSRTATGGLAQVIAEEGGMESVLWPGPRRKATKSEPVRMTIAVVTDHFSYELNCGLPAPFPSFAFNHDPEVKGIRLVRRRPASGQHDV